MAKSKARRALPYVLGSAFALLVSACIGSLTFLVMMVLLPYFDILPPEAEPVGIGAGALLAFISLLIQLWAFAIHDTLRPRRSAQIASRTHTRPH